MWKYIRRYLPYAILAAIFMAGEVYMDLIQPRIMTTIVDEGVLGVSHGGAGDLNVILQSGLLMIVLVLIGGLCGCLNNVFVHLSGQNIGNEIRKDCFRKIMTFSFPQVDAFGTGSLVTRVTNDVTQVQNLISQFVRGMIRTSMLTLGSMYCMYRLNAHFGQIILVAFPFLIGTMILCIHKADPLFTKLQGELDRINGILQEDISGIRVIKACVKQTYEKIRFGKANDELIATQLKTLLIFAFMNPSVNAIMYIAVTVILVVGSYETGQGMTTPGVIMAAITYTTQLLNGILMLVMLFQNISKGLASWKRIRKVLQSEPEITDGAFVGETQQRGEVEFRDVSFRYPNSDKYVLQNISLKVRHGETVAIMGATGCGKSTLVNLIPRFYDVTEGSILVDGVDVREYKLKDLREKVAIALQKSELFSASFADNIRWGKMDAQQEEIVSAAVTAQADDFITRTQYGYDTMIAERGMSLSSGQKQRISIARAVIRNAEIMIFDDSTSALDLKTEANLYQALSKSNPDSTRIIVAQRIASARNTDRIIVLDHGKIAAEGTHEQLLETSPVYQEIYYSQLKQEADV